MAPGPDLVSRALRSNLWVLDHLHVPHTLHLPQGASPGCPIASGPIQIGSTDHSCMLEPPNRGALERALDAVHAPCWLHMPHEAQDLDWSQHMGHAPIQGIVCSALLDQPCVQALKSKN